MKINQYLQKQKLSVKGFCEVNGFSYGYFRHILHGRARPSPDMALRIEKATHGKVDRLELLYPKAKN